MHRNNRHTHRGAALITAMLVLAIVAAIAASIMLQQQIGISRSELVFNANQAYYYTDMVNAWAENHYANLNKSKNSPAPKWPAIMPRQKLKYYNGNVQGILTSAQGRFNVNNLNDKTYIPLFANLIRQVNQNIDTDASLAIANQIAIWLNPANKNQKNKRNQQQNNKKMIRLLISPSELLVLPLVKPALYRQLAPYLIALPQETTLNPNTASKPLLMAYGLSSNAAGNVIGQRENSGGFSTMKAFQQVAKYKAAKGQQAVTLFALKSDYFLVQANIKLDKITLTNYAIMAPNKDKTALKILQQTQNTL
tara:strand:+ start:72914 stop:73837 length:924 start_codon:yes stop_codon:yes gene_type:complete